MHNERRRSKGRPNCAWLSRMSPSLKTEQINNNEEISQHTHTITSHHHHITTSPHHITTSPHHHITTSSHHHTIISPHHTTSHLLLRVIFPFAIPACAFPKNHTMSPSSSSLFCVCERDNG